ncbi:MAG: UDP-N-acetylmuramoyl-L-alanyl-D-glutamate--2,6-diaminopimelate ligase [Phycisphaeraceae bacterium]
MRLGQLIDDLPIALRVGSADLAITALTDDSRRVTPGALFIARPGADGDALRFVQNAIDAAAGALLLPDTDDSAIIALSLPGSVAVACADPGTPVDQRLCGQLAERFFDYPSRRLKLIGITGTNGKTTTATITRHLLDSAGHRCGLIGTVELDTGSADGPRPAQLTTPGAIELSQLLAEMVANGCDACVMEVSSHALHQGRVDHVRFAAAAFTNLTQDHLDYHGTMEAYADAKAILFESLADGATAVLNAADAYAARMARGCDAALLLTAVLPGACDPFLLQRSAERCAAEPITLTTAGSEAAFAGPWGAFDAMLPTPGPHNLSNALQAAALAFAVADLDATQLSHGLETCRPVPGRLEPVGPDWPEPPTPNPQLPTVLVDYAHTPDALINVGKALRELTQATGGKLITVFGCGGDRDRAKRPLMAQAAQRYADVVVLTSDNPRTEAPQQILNDAAEGFLPATQDPTPDTHTVPDRAAAIRFAIHLATEHDTVLIAGKGHEDYQIVGTTKHHFDDREQAAAALREKAGGT